MLQIRQNIFETNSSSVHCMTICDNEDFEKWKNGELLYNKENDKFCTREEAIEEVLEYYEKSPYHDVIPTKEEANDMLNEFEFCTYEEFGDDMEYFEKEYTTKSGDTVTIFGYYGYDG